MGKRAVIVIVIVAIVVAAAPPVFGIMYENQIREQIDNAPETAYTIFELADYERGFYSSHGTLRFALSDEYIEQLRDALETRDPANPTTPEQQEMLDNLLEFLSAELRFDIDVQHGPVMAADGISTGLATVRLEVDSTDGKLAELQESLEVPYLFGADAQVGFDGSADFQAAIPPFTKTDPDYSLDFSGLNYAGRFDRSATSVKAQGGTDHLLIETDSAQIAIKDIAIAGDTTMLSNSLWIGETSVDVAEVHIQNQQSAAGGSIGILGLGFDADVDLNDAADKFTIAVIYRVAGISGLPGNEIADLNVGLRFRNLDREAIDEYMRLVQQTGFAGPDAMGEMIPEFQSIGTKILRGSPGVDLSPVEFVLNGEAFTANIGIDFDGAALPADIDITQLTADLGVLIEALSAEGQIDSSEALSKTLAVNVLRAQIAQGVPPDAEITAEDIDAAARQQAAMMIDGMVQQGMILRQGDRLSANLSYADGQLFVNDVPIPLGQPGVAP